jgi:hypothetical protein
LGEWKGKSYWSSVTTGGNLNQSNFI